MFRLNHLILPSALFFCYQIACAESIMNKCTDGTEITYTDKPCEKLGLKSAGPIKYNVTITPAVPVTQIPQNRVRAKDASATAAPTSTVANSDDYQCTSYYGNVTYSSSPCPEFSYVTQLGVNKPVQQQTISRKSACEQMSANPEAHSGSSISCP